MPNQVSGVREIKKSDVVKQMCHFSGKFKKMVQEVCEIEDEINKNNLDIILCDSTRNKALKIQKLDLKRRIQFQINSFMSNSDEWKENHGDIQLSLGDTVTPSNGNGKNKKQTGDSKRSRQCRKINVGRSAVSRR